MNWLVLIYGIVLVVGFGLTCWLIYRDIEWIDSDEWMDSDE